MALSEFGRHKNISSFLNICSFEWRYMSVMVSNHRQFDCVQQFDQAKIKYNIKARRFTGPYKGPEMMKTFLCDNTIIIASDHFISKLRKQVWINRGC